MNTYVITAGAASLIKYVGQVLVRGYVALTDTAKRYEARLGKHSRAGVFSLTRGAPPRRRPGRAMTPGQTPPGGERFAYLTTKGRKSGKPHIVEVWYGIEMGIVYILAAIGDRADWVKNLRKDPQVSIRVGERTIQGRATVVSGGTEEAERARRLLDGKYRGWQPGKPLSQWATDALPIAVTLEY